MILSLYAAARFSETSSIFSACCSALPLFSSSLHEASSAASKKAVDVKNMEQRQVSVQKETGLGKGDKGSKGHGKQSRAKDAKGKGSKGTGASGKR